MRFPLFCICCFNLLDTDNEMWIDLQPSTVWERGLCGVFSIRSACVKIKQLHLNVALPLQDGYGIQSVLAPGYRPCSAGEISPCCAGGREIVKWNCALGPLRFIMTNTILIVIVHYGHLYCKKCIAKVFYDYDENVISWCRICRQNEYIYMSFKICVQ